MKQLLTVLMCMICAVPVLNNDGYQVRFIKDGIFGYGLTDREFAPIIIKTEEDLDGFKKDILKQYRESEMPQEGFLVFAEEVEKFYGAYDSDFFNKRNLVAALIDRGSGSLRFELSGLTLKDNTLYATVERQIPPFGTMDYRLWFMMLELDKQHDVNRVEIVLNRCKHKYKAKLP